MPLLGGQKLSTMLREIHPSYKSKVFLQHFPRAAEL